MKPFCPSAMTMSVRQERFMFSTGRALAQPSAEWWGFVGRIQTVLNSGDWKRHYEYIVLGLWQPKLQTSPRKYLVQDGQMQSEKAKLWLYSRLLDHNGFNPSCDSIETLLYKQDLGM